MGNQNDVQLSVGFDLENAKQSLSIIRKLVSKGILDTNSIVTQTKRVKMMTGEIQKLNKALSSTPKSPLQDVMGMKTPKQTPFATPDFSATKTAYKQVAKDIQSIIPGISPGTTFEAPKAASFTSQITKESKQMAIQASLNAKQIAQELGKLDKVFGAIEKSEKQAHSAGMQMTEQARRNFKKIAQAAKPMRQEFAGWAMSIMFFGMALKRTFDTIWKSSTKTFNDVMHSVEGSVTGFDRLDGSLKYLGFTAGAALEPVAAYLIPIIDRVSQWISENETLFAKIVIGTGILGTLFTILGSGVLAFNGFREALQLTSFDWDSWITKVDDFLARTGVKTKLDEWSKAFKQFSEKGLKKATDGFADMDSGIGKIIKKFGKADDADSLLGKVFKFDDASKQLKTLLKELDSSFTGSKISAAFDTISSKIGVAISKSKKLLAWQLRTSGSTTEDALKEVSKTSKQIDGAFGQAAKAAGQITKHTEETAAAAKALTEGLGGASGAGGATSAFAKAAAKELDESVGPIARFLAKFKGLAKKLPVIGVLLEGVLEIVEGLTEDVSGGKSVWASIGDVAKDVGWSTVIAGSIAAIIAAFVGGPILATAAAAAAVGGGITLLFSSLSEMIKQFRAPDDLTNSITGSTPIPQREQNTTYIIEGITITPQYGQTLGDALNETMTQVDRG